MHPEKFLASDKHSNLSNKYENYNQNCFISFGPDIYKKMF